MSEERPHPERNGYMGAIAEEIRKPYSIEELWVMFEPWMYERGIEGLSPREVRLLATLDASRAGPCQNCYRNTDAALKARAEFAEQRERELAEALEDLAEKVVARVHNGFDLPDEVARILARGHERSRAALAKVKR